MTPRERAEAARTAARLLPRTVVRGGVRIEFDAEPGLILNKAGEVVGVDAWVRAFRGANELQVDPHRICINPPTRAPDRMGKDGETIFREDPAEAYLTWLTESLRDVPNPKGWRTRGTVTTVYADTGDGTITSSSATYATARAGSGTISASTTATSTSIGSRINAGTYDLYQAFQGFDTSSIGDSDTISAVDLAVYCTTDLTTTENFVTNARLYDWSSGGVTTADWRTTYAQTLLATRDSVGLTTSAYNSFTESGADFQSNISKIGTTYLYLIDKRIEDNTAPAANERWLFSTANAAGTTQDPKLTITHTSPAAGFSFGVAIG